MATQAVIASLGAAARQVKLYTRLLDEGLEQ